MQSGTLARFESPAGAIAIDTPASGVVLVTIEGHDIGDFGSAPMERVDECISSDGPVELFIDARNTKGVSIAVSSEWARWLRINRARFEHVSMLTGSRFIEITADFVRRFSELQGVMRTYTDSVAFETALASSIADAERKI